MAKVHRYHLYVRRTNSMKWKLVAGDIKRNIQYVKQLGEDYLVKKYHDRGEIMIVDGLIDKVAYIHVRKPRILCYGKDSFPAQDRFQMKRKR